MGWNGPEPLVGGQLQSMRLSAVSWEPNRLDVFGIKADGTLQHWWYDNGAGNFSIGQPESLGGHLLPGPLSAVSWEPGRLDVFGIKADGTLQHWWYDHGAGNFSTRQPESLGDQLSPDTALSAVSWGPQRLDVFGIDEGTLQHWWYDHGAGNFSTRQPESLGGQLAAGTDALSAVSWGGDRLDVFGPGTDGTLQHWWYDHGAGNFSTRQPESLGGQLAVGQVSATGISAVSWGPQRLDVFGISSSATNNRLQHWWYDNGAGNFSTRQPDFLGVANELSAYTDLSAVSWGPQRLDIFGGGPEVRPVHLWYDHNAQNFQLPDFPLGGQFTTMFGLTAVSWGPGRLDIFGVADGTLQHWWYTAEQQVSMGVLNSLSLSPTLVHAGSVCRGIVTLEQRVSTETVVGLAALNPGARLPKPGSQSSLASTPPSVTIPAGGTIAEFEITTRFALPHTRHEVTIMAGAGDVTKYAVLTVEG